MGYFLKIQLFIASLLIVIFYTVITLFSQSLNELLLHLIQELAQSHMEIIREWSKQHRWPTENDDQPPARLIRDFDPSIAEIHLIDPAKGTCTHNQPTAHVCNEIMQHLRSQPQTHFWKDWKRNRYRMAFRKDQSYWVISFPMQTIHTFYRRTTTLLFIFSLSAIGMTMLIVYLSLQRTKSFLKKIYAIGENVSDFPPSGTSIKGSLEREVELWKERIEHLIQAIAIERQKFKTLIQSLPHPFILITADGEIEYHNQALQPFLRQRTTKLPKEHYLFLIKNKGLLTAIEQFLKKGKRISQPIVLQNSIDTQEERHYRAIFSPIAGTHIAVGLLIDISEDMALKRWKQELLSTIGHELKTPLTAAKGYLELYQNEHPPHPFLTKIDQNIERMIAIVEDLLVLSKMEEKPVVQCQPIVFQSFVEDMIQLQRPSIEKRHLIVSTDIPKDLVLHTDPFYLEKILSNLISNAVRYNRPGGEVIIRAKAIEQDQIQIDIIDSGIGIPPAFQKKIFERFFVLDAAKGGSGLGLAIVDQAVSLLGGKIEVQSPPPNSDRGSQFTVWLGNQRQDKKGLP